MHAQFFYNANAINSPPTIASPPFATFVAAALLEVAVAAPLDVVVPATDEVLVALLVVVLTERVEDKVALEVVLEYGLVDEKFAAEVEVAAAV